MAGAPSMQTRHLSLPAWCPTPYVLIILFFGVPPLPHAIHSAKTSREELFPTPEPAQVRETSQGNRKLRGKEMPRGTGHTPKLLRCVVVILWWSVVWVGGCVCAFVRLCVCVSCLGYPVVLPMCLFEGSVGALVWECGPIHILAERVGSAIIKHY